MKILPLFFFALFCGHAFAQAPLLTADEAVSIALESNYDIKIVRGDTEIAHLNNTRANAGMLPTVNLVANDNASLSAFQQRLSDGRNLTNPAAFFNSFNASVQLNWTLFDGGRMVIVKKRLEQQESLAGLNLQAQAQQTVAQVLTAYYDISRARLQARATEELIVLNNERLRIAEARLTAGMAAQTDALQARIDLNQRKSDLLALQNTIETTKRSLNRLLGRAPETSFEVEQNIQTTFSPVREELLQKMQAQNPAILALQKSTDIAALVVDENRTLSKPRLTGIGQVNALRTDNGAGIFRSNTQAGLTVGAAFIMPLYTGGNLRRQVETAQVAAQQSALRLDNQRLMLETEMDNQISTFRTQQQILALESSNVTSARESLNVSTERFRLGQTNALEVQAAQNNLEQALTRENLVRYNLKMTELRLRLLAGSL